MAKGEGGRFPLLLVKILVSSGLLLLLFSRISFSRFAEVLAGMSRGDLLLGVACLGISNVMGSIQWYALLRCRESVVTYERAFRFYFVGLFFNNFLPANVGGDAFRIYDVTKEGDSPYQALASTLLDRMIGLYSMCILALLAGLLLVPDGTTPWLKQGLFLFAAFLAPGTLLFFLKPGRSLVRRFISLIPLESLRSRGNKALDPLGEFTQRRRLIMGLVVFSLLIQGLRILAHVLVGRGMGLEIERQLLLQMFFYIPMLGLVMTIPITIGGLGLREGGSTGLFSAVGVPEAEAFALTFVTYGLNILVSLLGGFYFARRLFKGRQ